MQTNRPPIGQPQKAFTTQSVSYSLCLPTEDDQAELTRVTGFSAHLN